MNSTAKTLDNGTYISRESQLHQHLTSDRFIKRGDNGEESHFFYATATPTMINKENKPIIVYSQHKIGEPAVFFYDVNKKRDVCKVKGAEIFLMSSSSPDNPVEDILLFKADSVAAQDEPGGAETLS